MLDHLRNIHKGKRLFIIGTGPSLTEEQLDMVKGEITWGVNHLCEHTEFVPTYYAVSDFRETQSQDSVHKLERVLGNKKIEAYFSLNEAQKPIDVPGWTHIPRLARNDHCLHQGHMEGLGDTFEHIHAAHDACGEIPLQLGLWMGFTKIYLVGCDYTPGGHFYDHEARFSGGSSKKQGRVLQSFRVANEFMGKAKRQLISCTPKNELTAKGILPYIPLEEVLG